MIAAVLFASFAVLLLIGAPIAICLGVSSVAAMLLQGAGRPVETVMSSLPQLFSTGLTVTLLLIVMLSYSIWLTLVVFLALGLMILGTVLLLAALMIYNKPFEDGPRGGR